MSRKHYKYTIIQAEDELRGLGLREFVEFRRLLFWLAWRDTKVRYAETFVGMFWALLQPMALVAVFSIALGFLARVPSDGTPYTVFVIAGILVWLLFANVVSGVAAGIRMNAPLLSKIYCSRLVVATSGASAAVADFVVMFVAFVIAAIIYGIVPGPPILLALGFAIIALALGLAVGIWFAALTSRYADTGSLLPIILQAGMFASPVVYPPSIVPASWQIFYNLNPLSPIITGFRWAAYGGPPPDPIYVAIAGGTIILLGVTGLMYFNKIERTMIDRL